MPGATTIFHPRGICPNVKAAFKAYCAENHISMKEEIIRLMRLTLKGKMRSLPRRKGHPRNSTHLWMPGFPRRLQEKFSVWCKEREWSMAEKIENMMKVALLEARERDAIQRNSRSA